MENASYGKLRVPAKALATFLAVVLFVGFVPIWTAGTVTDIKIEKITFCNVPDADMGGILLFNPEDFGQTINDVTASYYDEDKNFTWTGCQGDLTAFCDFNNVMVERDGGFGTDPGDETFIFALYAERPNMIAYCANMEWGPWTPLSSIGTVTYNGVDCKKYVVPQGDISKGDFLIKIDEEPTYAATFSIVDGVTVSTSMSKDALETVVDSETVNVPQSGTLYISATADRDGYEPKISVSDGATVALQEDGTYEVSQMTKDFTVTVTLVPKIYSVTFACGDGVTVENQKIDDAGFAGSETTATYGQHLTFTVRPQEGWETAAPNVAVNGTPISPQEGGNEADGWNYNCEITGDTAISIAGFSQITHTVTVYRGDGFTLTPGASPLPWGSSYTFTIALLTGYHATTDSITLSAAGGAIGEKGEGYTVLDAGDGRFTITIEKVTDDLAITVNGIALKKYGVSVSPADDSMGGTYTVGEAVGQVDHGSSAVVTITPNEGYRIKSVRFQSGDGAITDVTNTGAAENKYASPAITADGGKFLVVTEAITFTVTYKFPSSAENMPGRTETASTSVTISYTVKGATANGQSIGSEKKLVKSGDGAGYTLALERPTRNGWKLSGWVNETYEMPTFEIRSTDPSDYAVTLDAKWEINADANSRSAFFWVNLDMFAFNEETKVTRFEASSKANTELTEEDKEEAGTIQVLCHGFLYARSEEAYDSAVRAETLSKIAKTLEDGTSWHMTKLSTGVFYYKHDDAGEDVDAYEDGSFNLTLRNTDKNGKYVGSAWVLMRINGETYLFVSGKQDLT